MEKLKTILNERGLNASSLSDKMALKGVKLSRVAIGNILSGKHSPKLSTLEDIASFLNLHVCDFLDDRPKDGKAIFEKLDDGSMKQIGILNDSE